MNFIFSCQKQYFTLSLRSFVKYRVPKCEVIKNEICEIMGFVKIFRKNNVQDAYSPKISNLEQIVSEILTQLCSDDSIQILLNLIWFLILWTKPNLEWFVWSRHSITGLISQRQFAPNIGQVKVFYDILERENAFLGYKNKKFKKSKNWYFSERINPWFWSKSAHFSNFF